MDRKEKAKIVMLERASMIRRIRATLVKFESIPAEDYADAAGLHHALVYMNTMAEDCRETLEWTISKTDTGGLL